MFHGLDEFLDLPRIGKAKPQNDHFTENYQNHMKSDYWNISQKLEKSLRHIDRV